MRRIRYTAKISGENLDTTIQIFNDTSLTLPANTLQFNKVYAIKVIATDNLSSDSSDVRFFRTKVPLQIIHLLQIQLMLPLINQKKLLLIGSAFHLL